MLNRIRAWIKTHLARIVEQKWFNLGLRGKMGLLVTVGMSGLVLVFSLLGISTARRVTRQVLSERVMLARQSAAALDSTFSQAQTFLHMLSQLDVFHRLDASPEQIEAALQQGGQYADGVYFLDRERRPLAQNNTAEFDWSEVWAVNEALQGAKFSLSVLEPSLSSGDPSSPLDPAQHTLVAAAIPVGSATSEQSGVLVAIIDLDRNPVFSLGRPFNLGATGTLDVVDSKGRVLASTHVERRFLQEAPDTTVSRLFGAGEPRVETCLGCYDNDETAQGSDEVIAFAPLEAANWGVVVRQKADEVFSPVRRLTALTLGFGVITMLGAIVLVGVTTSSVIKPVQALTEAARRMAEGDLSTPINLTLHTHMTTGWRRDEIGDLAESFITMHRRLKHSMEEIQALNRHLDARVQERTKAALQAQREAQAARDDLRAVIDALSDELVVIGAYDRQVQQVNRAVLSNNGWEMNSLDLTGKNCYEVCHRDTPCTPPSCDCPVPEVLKTGHSVKVTHSHEQPDGSIRYFDVVASPLRDENGEITRIVELSRDVTEDRRVRESLVRRNQQLSIVNAVAITVNQSLDLNEILDRALNEVLSLTGIDAGAVFLVEEALGNLKLAAYQGLSEDAARLASQVGMLDGACGGVIEAGQIVIVPDIARFRGHRARSLQRENLNTLVHVPLIAKGCTLGSMCVGTRQCREFSAEEQELLNAIGSQIAVAIENARLYAEVQHKEHIRGELFRKAINAQEDERKRIARELHDEISQALTAMLFAAEEALDMDDPAKIKARLSSMHDLAQHTLDGVHKIIFDLRPSMLDHLGLVPALRWFASTRLESKGIRVNIEETRPDRRLPPEVETVLFRVVQEAIVNIARHAAARNVGILFQTGTDTVTVTVEDDGIGFDMDSLELTPDHPRGLGLMGMQERVELLGGDLEFDSQPGFGTRIVIRLPLA